jgi:hypothetical protein
MVLDGNAKKLKSLHLRLAAFLSPLDWEYIDKTTTIQGERSFSNHTERQTAKYDRLTLQKKTPPEIDRDRIVVNLTEENLDETTISVLSKGLNFAPSPKSIPYTDIIGGVEQAINKIPREAADDIRSEIAMVLKRAVVPKPNLTWRERNAIHSLRKNEDLAILPADKGNATVVMTRMDYHKKIEEILQDNAYRPIPRDPTESKVRKTIELIKKSALQAETRTLVPQAPVPPRLYGLPKIHKMGAPLRPIVSAINSPTYCLAKYLTGILSPHVGCCEHHVKNSTDFIETLRTIRLEPGDIMVSFDVISLFTRIPLEDSLQLLEKRFDAKTVNLFHHVLKSTYFTYDGKFYEQTDGVAMGSPLSPAIANFFMEDFEERALSTAALKPKCFFRYVDDTFIVWSHGLEALQSFLNHMNEQHRSIKFTMEMEKDGTLPFLDILIYRKEDGSLGHRVYRKPTHTNLYLNGRSHHHPSQRRGVISTLLHRARSIANEESLPAEINHLKTTFRQNGYSEKDITSALKRTFSDRKDAPVDDNKPIANACLPYVSTISGKISRILGKYNIRTIHKPPQKLRNKLVRVKDDLGLKTPGVYRIPCECGEAYIGETARTIETRMKEHRRNIRLCQPEKSAVAEHSINLDHKIKFDNAKLLGRSNGYWDRITKEAIEIRMEVRNFNRDTGYALSAAWNPALRKIKTERRKIGESQSCGS